MKRCWRWLVDMGERANTQARKGSLFPHCTIVNIPFPELLSLTVLDKALGYSF